MENPSDQNATLNSTGNYYTTTSSTLLLKCQLYFGIPVMLVIFTSVVICITVIVVLVKSKSGNFFKWNVVDRFSMYNAVGDLLLYAAQSAFGINRALSSALYKRNIEGLACSIHAITILEFAIAQEIFGEVTAVYAFVLITKQKHISFGRYDHRLLVPLFGIPLIILILAAYFDQFRPNIAYCGFKEEQGFITWHFLLYFSMIFFSFIFVIVLYVALWCFVNKHSKANAKNMKQSSAVNSRRVAFKLSLYVAVYAIQFCGHMVEGLWTSITTIPEIGRIFIILISASGGIMNGIVFLAIRRG